jgi:hypothetical protein
VAASHPASASPVASPSQRVSPAISEDRAVCNVFSANIGVGGEQAMANALIANPLVSRDLAHEIRLALTSTTLKANMNGQIMVTLDCVEAKSGAIPSEG